LVYSTGIKDRFRDIDFIISAGDLDLNYYGYIVSSLNKSLFFVFGNHNLKEISRFRREYSLDSEGNVPFGMLRRTYGSTYIGDRVIKKNGLLIAGLGGSYSYNKGKNQYSEFQMALKILHLLPPLVINRVFRKRWLDILVTHAPVRGINDREDLCHRGFKVFRLFLKIFKPMYHLHGHVHLYDLNAKREIRFCQTTIINVYESYILEVNLEDVKQHLYKSKGK